MKIYLDGYEANVPQRLGSSQVAFELLRSLEQIDHRNDYTIFLPTPPLKDLPKEREGWRYKILKPRRLWTRIALPLALFTAKQRPDLFFSPTHYLPRFSPSAIKKIVTIFDLSFLHFPESFLKKDLWQLKNWTKFSVENADRIITISKFSKLDIVSHYGIDKSKITVAYPGYDKNNFKFQISNFKLNTVQNRYKVGNNYIIYIGTIQPRKNLVRLMESFARVVGRFHPRGVIRLTPQDNSWRELKLVVVGKTSGEGREGWMYEDILKTPKRLGIEDKVKFLGFVPTDDLVLLLSKATAFILPSLWEGFGISTVEAMASGTPVIVSNVSSLPEVVGKAGLLVDPYSIDQMEQAIRLITTDKKLRQKYAKEGIIQARKFSWDKMAKIVLKVFEDLGKV